MRGLKSPATLVVSQDLFQAARCLLFFWLARRAPMVSDPADGLGAPTGLAGAARGHLQLLSF